MDRVNRKLLQKSHKCTIVDLRLVTASNDTYLVLDLVDKNQRLKELSLLLQTPSRVLTKGIQSHHTSTIIGYMGLTISCALVEDNTVLFFTDGNHLQVNLSTKECSVVSHKDGLARFVKYHASREGFL